MKIKDLTIGAVVAALYVVLTSVPGLNAIAYGPVQFRIAEALVLLCFFNKKYFLPLTIGCLVSNFIGVATGANMLGMLDVIIGTAATVLALLGVMYSKNIIVASIFPTISNGIIIGLEICYVSGTMTWAAFFINAGWVALGEFVCVTILGVILFTLLKRNRGFMKLIDANQNYTFSSDEDVEENN